jgi:pimeloyl-ACP methyl ester carboxylesterase
MISSSHERFGGVATRTLSVSGTGPLVVLFHGWADHADTWRDVLTALDAAGQRAIAVDLPGFGDADERKPGPVLDQFVDFAEALVSNHESVVLVGNSIGATTALCVARGPESDRVRGLVLLNEPTNVSHLPARLARRFNLQWLAKLLAVLPIPARLVQWWVRLTLPHSVYGPGSLPTPEVLARWAQVNRDMKAVSFLAQGALMLARETNGLISPLTLDCPTLIVHGAHDRIIPASSSTVLHGMVAGSQLVMLSESGHCPQLDNPGAVTQLIIDTVVAQRNRPVEEITSS